MMWQRIHSLSSCVSVAEIKATFVESDRFEREGLAKSA